MRDDDRQDWHKESGMGGKWKCLRVIYKVESLEFGYELDVDSS